MTDALQRLRRANQLSTERHCSGFSQGSDEQRTIGGPLRLKAIGTGSCFRIPIAEIVPDLAFSMIA